MVRFRIFRVQAIARLRALTSDSLSSILVVAAIFSASLSGSDGDSGPAPAAAVKPPPIAGEAEAVETASSVETASNDEIGSTGQLTSESEPRLPAHLLQVPPSAQNALIFDLKSNRMLIYQVGSGELTSMGDYFVAVGKNGIDKRREGDEKTPVGIYFVTSYIPGDELPAIYGVGAFPISYPNAWDRRLSRTGSGIWIHGTDKDDESLLPQSSRGCLTLRNQDFTTLSEYVDIRRTPVIVSDAVHWTSPTELKVARVGLAAAVEAWRADWESLDIEAYFQHYAADFRTDSMDREAWIAYKRRVNSAKTYIEVDVEDIGIYAYPGESDLFLVTFEQRYRSNNFRAQKWKHQYWRHDAGDWRIVHES